MQGAQIQPPVKELTSYMPHGVAKKKKKNPKNKQTKHPNDKTGIFAWLLFNMDAWRETQYYKEVRVTGKWSCPKWLTAKEE